MALTATFTADFSRWQQSLKDAQAALKPMEVSAKNLQAQLKNLATSYSGATTIKQANLTAAAIESIGGASKLTATEISKATGTIDEAIAKYKLMGETAPAQLHKISEELKAISGQGIDKSAMASLQGFSDTADSASSSLLSLKSVGVAAIGGLAAAFGAAASSVIDYGGHLEDLQAQTGISTDGLQTLGAVGKTVGLSLDDIATSVGQLSKRLAGGDDGAVAAVQSLGLNLKELVGLAPDQAFEEIAKAVGDVENPMDRVRIATELLGKAGAQALPILNGQLHDLRAAAEQSGQVINERTVKAMDDLGDAWSNLKTTGAVLISDVLSPMLPLLKSLTEAATSWSAQLHKDAADQSQAISDAWANLKKIGADIPGFFSRLQASAYTGLSVLQTGADSAAASTTNLGTATKGTLDQITLAANRLKAMQTDALAPLTAAQGKLIDQFQKFGVSNKDIAELIGSNALAVNAYTESHRALNEQIKQNAEAVKKLHDALTGAALAQEAQNLSAALKGVDLSKLSGAGLDTLSKQLTATIDGYQDLGKAAPQALMNANLAVLQLRASSVDLRGEVGDVTKAYQDLNAALMKIVETQQTQESSGFMGNQAAIVKATMDSIDKSTVDSLDKRLAAIHDSFDAQRNALNVHVGNYQDALAAIDRDEQITAQNATDAWNKSFAQITSQLPSFSKLFSDTLHSIPQSIQQSLTGGGGFTGALKAVASSAGSGIGTLLGAKVASGLSQAVTNSGSKVFAGLVNMIPGVGAAIGAVIGPLIGKLFGPSKGKILGEQADASIQKLQDSLLQTYGSLDNLRKMGGKAGAALADAWGDKNVQGLAHFQGLVDDLNESMAAQQKLVSDLTDTLNRGTLATTGLLTQLAKVEPGTEGAAAAFDFLKKNIGNALGGLEEFAKTGVPVTQKSASALGASVYAVFEQLQATGMSLPDALKAITPALDDLTKQFLAAGVTGGSAFDDLRADADIASSTIAGPAIDAVAGLNKVLVGLGNTGLLNQDTFEGLASQVSTTFDSLVKQGFDGNRVLQLMQPTLQTIFELQEQFGFKTDDATQALEDQAKAAGLVGDQFKDPQQQMLKGIQDLIDRIGKLIDTITGAGGINAAINSIPTDIDVKVHGSYVPPDIPGVDEGPQTHGGSPPSAPPGFAGGTRGLRNFGREMLVRLHGKEAVLTEDQYTRVMGAAAMGLAGGHGGGAQPVQQTIVVQLNDRALINAVVKGMPGTLTLKGAR